MIQLPRRGIGLLAAFACTLLALPAQSWTEVGAGSTWTSSETPLGRGPLTSIQGTLAAGQPVDLYLVHVDDPATFRVSTVGGASFDTQLWMFDVDGHGIAFRDDDPSVTQATLSGQFLGGPGTVLIGVSEYDNDPLDVNGAQLWSDTPYTVERQPDGPGAANAFTQWSGTSTLARPYTLSLAGASFAAEANPADTQVALAWIDGTNPAATFVADTGWQHTPTGERIVANRLATGRFRIDLPKHLSPFGNVQVTSYGSSDTAIVESFTYLGGKLAVWVNTVDMLGQPVDAPFNLVYRVGGRPTDRTAYLLADQPSAASYLANSGYAWNGNRGLPSIVRLGTGLYRVTLPGLGSGSTLGGHNQVSPITINTLLLRRAQVDSWAVSGSDLHVFVRTFDGAGTATDATFLLSYTETAADQPAHLGSGAYVYANNPTAPVYTVGGSYSTSNGNAGPHTPITITRVGTGTYVVHLPDHAQAFGVPVVNLYGTQPGLVSTPFWATGSPGGTDVVVHCRDVAGNFADRVFLLQWTSAFPAGTPGRNEVVGAGCYLATLRGTTRPTLGGTWQLAIENLPATATLPFTFVGLGDPNLALDAFGLPGCVLHADTTVLVFGASNPAFTFAVPNSAALISLPLYAQGGALDATANAVGAGFANAIRGVIGNV